ncbi:hypothetical protein [Streptomyces sp. NPDC058622]
MLANDGDEPGALKDPLGVVVTASGKDFVGVRITGYMDDAVG